MNPFRASKTYWKKDKVIKNILKKSPKSVVYGMRSIQVRLGRLNSRKTQDWDILHPQPRKFARKIERRLDRMAGNRNAFYVQPAQHPGTHKVKYSNYTISTHDDIEIADVTKMTRPKPRFQIINGIRYRVLDAELQAKRKAIRDPAYAFRKEKDTWDAKDIEKHQLLKKNKFLRNFLM